MSSVGFRKVPGELWRTVRVLQSAWMNGLVLVTIVSRAGVTGWCCLNWVCGARGTSPKSGSFVQLVGKARSSPARAARFPLGAIKLPSPTASSCASARWAATDGSPRAPCTSAPPPMAASLCQSMGPRIRGRWYVGRDRCGSRARLCRQSRGGRWRRGAEGASWWISSVTEFICHSR